MNKTIFCYLSAFTVVSTLRTDGIVQSYDRESTIEAGSRTFKRTGVMCEFTCTTGTVRTVIGKLGVLVRTDIRMTSTSTRCRRRQVGRQSNLPVPYSTVPGTRYSTVLQGLCIQYVRVRTVSIPQYVLYLQYPILPASYSTVQCSKILCSACTKRPGGGLAR